MKVLSTIIFVLLFVGQGTAQGTSEDGYLEVRGKMHEVQTLCDPSLDSYTLMTKDERYLLSVDYREDGMYHLVDEESEGGLDAVEVTFIDGNRADIFLCLGGHMKVESGKISVEGEFQLGLAMALSCNKLVKLRGEFTCEGEGL